jgi:hypothetical protein
MVLDRLVVKNANLSLAEKTLVSMVDFVFQWDTGSNVSVQLVLLVVVVKPTLMNVLLNHVITMEFAKIFHKAINVSVLQDTQASTVKKKNPIVATTLAQPEQCAKTNQDSKITPASAEVDTLVMNATLQSIHAQQTEIHVEMVLRVLLFCKVGSSATACQDGKVKLVKSIQTIALKIPACWEQTAQIWSMILCVRVHQDLLENVANRRLTCVCQNLANMELASTDCTSMNVCATQDGLEQLAMLTSMIVQLNLVKTMAFVSI